MRPFSTRCAEPSPQLLQPPAVAVAACAGAADVGGVVFDGSSRGVVLSAAVAVRATAAETPSASRPRRKRFISTPFGSDPGRFATITLIIGALRERAGFGLKNSAAPAPDLPGASVAPPVTGRCNR